MIGFLQRYQKYFLFVITMVVIASFIFFGTFSTFIDVRAKEDKTIGQAVDGSDLKLLEITALSRFLSADREDLYSGGLMNLLNDGVIRRDLLATGVADLLVQGNDSIFRPQIEQKLQRVKAYRSYEHPEAPFLSAKAIWQKFAPDINREWAFLQSETEANEETFSHLVNLYQLQSALPATWLKRMLLLHEQQCGWLRPDPRLRQDDLSLFGFRTLSDWFGKDFIDLMAEFIHNAAIVAESQGYKVSLAEAKADLKKNFAESVQKWQSQQPISWSYKDQLHMLGMEEREAAHIWRKVLLYRRSVQDLGGAAFIDRLPYTEFATLAQEKAAFDLYQWPSVLKMTTNVDLYAFRTYLRSIAPPLPILALPGSTYSVGEVARKTPTLVGVAYKAKVFAADKREISLKASLKEVWEFETGNEAWAKLRGEFPFLCTLPGRTVEERFSTLDKLDPHKRSQVDFFARRLLVDRHPEWVDATLQTADGKEMRLTISDGKIELPHVDDPARLAALFEQIPSSPEAALLALQHFDTRDVIFRFENVEKLSGPHIKTYEEARKDGSLMALVGTWATSDRAEEEAGLRLADWNEIREPEVPMAISYWKALATRAKEDLSASNEKWLIGKEGPQPLHSERTIIGESQGVSENAKDEVNPTPPTSKWLKAENEDPLLAQFKMERMLKEITRTSEEHWMAKAPFLLVSNQWSPVHAAKDGLVQFIFLQSRVSPKAPVLDQIFFGQGMVAADVQRVLATNLLESMQRKRAIVIPLQQEQE